MTCYHEAGHVVSAIRYMILPLNSQVMSKGHLDGHTSLTYYKVPLTSSKFKSLAKSRLHTYAAGLIAEDLFYRSITGQNLPKRLREGGFQDAKEFNSLLKKYEPNAPARVRARKKIENDTRKQLVADWQIVMNLAYALYDKKFLDYKSISAVVIGSVPRDSSKRMREYLKALEHAYNSKTPS